MSEDYLYWKKRDKNDSRLDWRNGAPDWIQEYWDSRKHPHRKLIIEALDKFRPFGSVLELGCNCGPNLANIKDRYPKVKLAGIDANADAITRGKELLDADLRAGTFFNLPWEDQSFDIVLADATLMYADKNDIIPVLLEVNRVARRGVIFVEWFSESIIGKVKNFHWARNYPKLLKRLGFKVRTRKLNESTWPSKNWVANGRVFVGRK